MPLHMVPPLPAYCIVNSANEGPCSPRVAEAPWQGIAVHAPQMIHADSPADFEKLRVPCFLTIAHMVNGADREPLMVQFIDPQTGRAHEVPIQPPGDRHIMERPVPPTPDGIPNTVLTHVVRWQSLDLTDSHAFHVGINRIRFRVGQVLSPEVQVSIEVAHSPQAR